MTPLQVTACADWGGFILEGAKACLNVKT